MHRLFSIFLIPVLIILCSSGLVFGGEFETALEKAEQGNSTAHNSLGIMYYKDHGGGQNFKESYIWNYKAIKLGNQNAIRFRKKILKKLTAQEIEEAEKEATKPQKKVDSSK